LIEGGPVQGPMFQANHDSLQYLKSDDIRAIYIYLASVSSTAPKKPNTQGSAFTGKIIYDQYCKQCHEHGKGPIEGAPQRDDIWAWRSLRKMGTAALLWYSLNGVDGMPIKGTCTDCSIDDIHSALQYILAE